MIRTMNRSLPAVLVRRLALAALPLALSACIVEPAPRDVDQGYVSGGGYYEDDGYGDGYSDGYYDARRNYAPGYGPYYGGPAYYSDPYYGRVYYGPTWYGPGYYYGPSGVIVYRDRVDHYYRDDGRRDGDWSRAHRRNDSANSNPPRNNGQWQPRGAPGNGSYNGGNRYEGPAPRPAQRNGSIVDDARRVAKPESVPAPRAEAPPPPAPVVPQAAPRSAPQPSAKVSPRRWNDRDRNEH